MKEKLNPFVEECWRINNKPKYFENIEYIINFCGKRKINSNAIRLLNFFFF